MTYQIDPNLRHRVPSEEPDEGHCNEPAAKLLDCLGLPSEGIKSVRLTRVTLDITFSDEDCEGVRLSGRSHRRTWWWRFWRWHRK